MATHGIVIQILYDMVIPVWWYPGQVWSHSLRKRRLFVGFWGQDYIDLGAGDGAPGPAALAAAVRTAELSSPASRIAAILQVSEDAPTDRNLRARSSLPFLVTPWMRGNRANAQAQLMRRRRINAWGLTREDSLNIPAMTVRARAKTRHWLRPKHFSGGKRK